MSVRIVEERFVTPMTCSRCKYRWNYSGKNTYVATCPYCRTKLSIKKNSRVPLTGPTSLGGGEPVIGTEQSINGSDSADG